MTVEWRARDYIAPRYWPTWFLLALLRLCIALPFRLQLLLGKFLGKVLYLLLPSRRKIATTNISLCFPDLNRKEKRQLCRQCFESVGIAAFEMVLGWWGDKKRLAKLLTIEGLEYIEQAQQQNRPVLLLSGHVSCSDIGGALLAQHLSFQVMYKPAKNKLFETIMLRSRSQLFFEMVPRKNSRRLLKNLKNGVATWYAPDQNFGRETTVFAPFFGVEAVTLTAPSRIARFANAVVLPFFPYRLPNARGYRLLIGPPLQSFPSDNELADAILVNQTIENAVRIAPEQYLWLHKRFRIRPPGEPPIYL